MDADCIDIQRDRVLSRREKRWSMNSQRLEEIVAELMKPISDVRRSFDTDLSALLEEYLTEAGLHALEAGEGADEDDLPPMAPAPNFAELALLLQHSASIYGRKVDFLYQHVLSVSDSLQNSTQELERSGAEGEGEAEGSPARARRRRRASSTATTAATAGFAALEPAPGAGCEREAGPARPPPTLPRVYIELEPRQRAPSERPLTDYDGEPVGLLADFHVAWRLQDGMLVDELEGWGGSGRDLRPIPLMELQAAIEAAAPPALPPPPDLSASRPVSPPSPEPEPEPAPPHPVTPPHAVTPPVKKDRKRRCEISPDDRVGGCFKIVMNEELLRKLRKLEEFSVDEAWIASVVAMRRDHIRGARLHRLEDDSTEDFRGFDVCDLDVGGFTGWSSTAAETATGTSAPDGDSDDDGFFEQSSLGDSDTSRVDDSTLSAGVGGVGDGDAAWQARVVARAAACEARGLDVAELAGRVLRRLPGPAGPAAAPVACDALLAGAARDRPDVSGLFLATLFLANAGNVEVVRGAPLSLNSFSTRLLSTDARLYSAAARDDPHFLR